MRLEKFPELALKPTIPAIALASVLRSSIRQIATEDGKAEDCEKEPFMDGHYLVDTEKQDNNLI